MRAIDLIGQKFGRLTVLKRIGSNKEGKALWFCQCDCGNKAIIIGYNLRHGRTKSCGCLQKELLINRITTHNMTHTSLYVAWIQMRDRCKNTANESYHNYGGRGIIVCERWEKFENFYSDMGECPKGLTLERIDNNKGYSPDNCKWATRKEQANNSRKNVIIEYKGQRLTIVQWARKIGIKCNTLSRRIQRHWPIEKALDTKQALEDEPWIDATAPKTNVA